MRCPTHPAEILREDVPPALSLTSHELSDITGADNRDAIAPSADQVAAGE